MKNIKLDGYYDYHNNIHDMLNKNFGFRISKTQISKNTYLRGEEINKEAEKYLKSLKDAEQETETIQSLASIRRKKSYEKKRVISATK